MGFKLTSRDLALLAGVNPDLVRVITKAASISDIPFKVTEGLRTVARQKQLVAGGFSTTMNSRHLTGHAVDIVPMVDINGDGKVDSTEMYSWPIYHKLAPIIKRAAQLEGVPIEWGGDWKNFKDGPHWQLPFKSYPRNSQPMSFLASYSGVDDLEVALDPECTDETDTQAHTKALSAAVGGVGTGIAVGYEPVTTTLIQTISAQQFELSSGNAIRIGIAAVIVGLTLWYAWKKG